MNHTIPTPSTGGPYLGRLLMSNGTYREPTKQDFPIMSIKEVYYRGVWFEDAHWWWRHLPRHQQYIPNS